MKNRLKKVVTLLYYIIANLTVACIGAICLATTPIWLVVYIVFNINAFLAIENLWDYVNKPFTNL